jgi:ribosomal protein S18 acetylase RimI-like enzyme
MVTSVKMVATPTYAPNLRPLDAHKDLSAVADLIEIGFSDTLDDDGRRYLSQMRSTARTYEMSWFGMSSILGGFSSTGYVWEEDGRLVGNLSLIPYLIGTRRCFLIANVVVHPDFRRRGIARALTSRAIEHAKAAAAPSAWLHVRPENDAAIDLYKSLGFIEKARRTSWHSPSEARGSELAAGLKITSRRAGDWSVEQTWLANNYPHELTWSLPFRLKYLRPGIIGFLSRVFGDAYLMQWGIYRRDRLCAAAAWQSNPGNTNLLWLGAPVEADDDAVKALLQHICKTVSARRPMILDYPAGQTAEAIQAAGFHARQTLIWMEIKL